MKDTDLYGIFTNAIGGYIPVENLKPFLPYQDTVTPPMGDYYTLNITSIRDVGWSQERQGETTETGVEVLQDTQRVYGVQFDFYGKNALNNANIGKQALHSEIRKNKQISLKEMSEIRNLTELEENGKFLKRYSFDLGVFVADTLEPIGEEMYLKQGQILIINRGNNERI
jgi:hypothetical protein